MNEMNQLAAYVLHHAVRGACQCGQCIDAPASPEIQQPTGHTADMVFFHVAAYGANAEEFTDLIRQACPQYLNGKEYSYIEIGGDMGDQGLALMTMGLGVVLGVWQLLSPKNIFGNILDQDLLMKMVGMGMLHIKARTN